MTDSIVTGFRPNYGAISGSSHQTSGATGSAGLTQVTSGLPGEIEPVHVGVGTGYESVYPDLTGGANREIIAPVEPPIEQAVRGEPARIRVFSEFDRPHVTEAEAREALLTEIWDKCCYGTGAVSDLTFTSISTSYVSHLTLETFTEKRELIWQTVPYIPGQPVDGPSNGPAPGPWDLVCHPTQMFEDQVTNLEVPHTSKVQVCIQCSGIGKVKCIECGGGGFRSCVPCSGRGFSEIYEDGRRINRSCPCCFGRGTKKCLACDSQGLVRCPCCTGFGNVRFYLIVKVTFQNCLKEIRLQEEGLPKSLDLSKAQGYEQSRQEGARVQPLDNHPDPKIVQYSRELSEKAKSEFKLLRILRQRQVLRSIPVSVCQYMYKKSSGVFWVYGTDHQVAYLEYPQNCCCCCQCNTCNIL